MAKRTVKIWCDQEGDYWEVIFDPKPGFFRETTSDQVMEKVGRRESLGVVVFDSGQIVGHRVQVRELTGIRALSPAA